MMMPSPRLAHRLLTFCGLASLAIAGTALQAQTANPTGGVSVRFASPEEVLDIGSYPNLEPFRDLFTFPVEEGLTGESPDYWVVRGVESFAVNHTTESTRVDALDRRYLALYEAVNSGSRRVSERGVLGWDLKSENAQWVNPNGTIGFIRSSHRPSQLPATPVTGFFTGANGQLEWWTKATTRNARIAISGANHNEPATFQDVTTLTAGPSQITLGSLQFDVANLSPPAFWRFSNTTPTELAEGVYFDIISRTDTLTTDELPTAISGDPHGFWNRHYFFLILDERDSDRDGVPDFADLTESVEPFPWYASYDYGNNFYYVNWMNAAVYSNPRISDNWHYNYNLGWTYVPMSSDADNFWIYVNSGGLGWMYTSQHWYPTFYRYPQDPEAEGDYLYLTNVENGVATFYNYRTDSTFQVQL